MKVGDLVVIVDNDHPWHGETGEIVEPAGVPGSDWVVQLRGTYLPSCGVAEEEMRLV